MKIIIIGCGKVGVALAEGLSGEQYDVVLVDTCAEKASAGDRRPGRDASCGKWFQYRPHCPKREWRTRIFLLR